MLNNNNNQFEFLDILNIMSFYIGLLNLNQNLTQNDKQDLQKQLDEKINLLLKEIHTHLEQQDEKINNILEMMKNDR